ncbi:carboxypeptidase-like regulatory domain-containing protein [Edaphobacter aggregans]|uniref:carboxypeptidase-like regulatory domain-containing protein n=1 Tax=Edaphobacter aggregans TaxID=570835 RepID=UPI0009FD2B5A|nr:carboxypeptidase-like regulatory domain-containing protein [Edaphobacter aggregans]
MSRTAVIVGFPAWLAAQSGASAALSGMVMDGTGAAVPGAMVTATYLSSQAERSATTGVDGGFLFLQLNGGTYRVQVQAPEDGPAQPVQRRLRDAGVEAALVQRGVSVEVYLRGVRL